MSEVVEIEHNVPELRFPGFDEDWNSYRLEELGVFKNGYNANKEAFGSGTPFVNLMDVFGYNTIPNVKFGLVEASARDITEYSLINGDIIFVRSSVKRDGVGQACLVNSNLVETIYSGFLIRYRIHNESFYTNFRPWSLNSISFRKQILSVATSSANTNINQENLSILSVNLPNEKEQQKIASFLTAIDEKIAQLQKKKTLLETYKKGCMQKLFSQAIRFKDDNGNDYPDWEERQLGDVANIIGGGTPDSQNKEYWKGDIHWFTPSEIKSKYLSTSVRTITSAGLRFSSAKMLPIGTLLLSTRATVGEVGIAKQECCTNQGFQSLEVKGENYNEFWYYWILMHKKELLRRASGSTFLEIGKSEISKIPVACPSPKEQLKIADFLSAIDDKITLTTDQHTYAKTFKKGLLQKMFV